MKLLPFVKLGQRYVQSNLRHFENGAVEENVTDPVVRDAGENRGTDALLLDHDVAANGAYNQAPLPAVPR